MEMNPDTGYTFRRNSASTMKVLFLMIREISNGHDRLEVRYYISAIHFHCYFRMFAS